MLTRAHEQAGFTFSQINIFCGFLVRVLPTHLSQAKQIPWINIASIQKAFAISTFLKLENLQKKCINIGEKFCDKSV